MVCKHNSGFATHASRRQNRGPRHVNLDSDCVNSATYILRTNRIGACSLADKSPVHTTHQTRATPPRGRRRKRGRPCSHCGRHPPPAVMHPTNCTTSIASRTQKASAVPFDSIPNVRTSS